MRKIFQGSLIVLMSLLLVIAMVGCEGKEGPEGPAGPAGDKGDPGDQGDPGPGYSPYTYLGNDGEACTHCHGYATDSWMETNHADAYADLDASSQARPYCLQCHTTGWDSEVGYADTTVTPNGADVNGYDDYFMVDGDEAAMRRTSLEGVQCEA